MFIIQLDYKKPLATVEAHTDAHRAFLQAGYDKDYFIASGPRVPRDGGFIISQLQDRALLEDFFKDDPFYIYDIADYQIFEWNPIKYHPDFKKFLSPEPL
jgi:uncharacterized protein YciI